MPIKPANTGLNGSIRPKVPAQPVAIIKHLSGPGKTVSATKPPKDETREQRFDRIAKRRMGQALKAINLLGNLGGPAYAPTEAKINKMEHDLTEEIRKSFILLRGRTQRKAGEFSFDE